jgi:hypothetical protein
VNQSNAAFGLPEFFIVIVSILFLFLVVHDRLKCKGPGLRTKCTSSLKQVALAFNLWAQDNETGLPMQVSESKGGTREAALAGQLLPNLLIMSNQIRTPSILICPEDKKRKPAETFAKLTTANISYFLNIDAALTNQNHILAGDRSLAIAGSPVKPGSLQITNASDVQWANWLHDDGGNVALVDGSAHQVTTHGLRSLLTATGPTNRFIIP